MMVLPSGLQEGQRRGPARALLAPTRAEHHLCFLLHPVRASLELWKRKGDYTHREVEHSCKPPCWTHLSPVLPRSGAATPRKWLPAVREAPRRLPPCGNPEHRASGPRKVADSRGWEERWLGHIETTSAVLYRLLAAGTSGRDWSKQSSNS